MSVIRDFFKIMKTYSKKELKWIIFSFIILLIYSLTNLVSPALVQYLIDQIIIGRQISLLYKYIIFVVILLALASATGLTSNYLLVRSFENISKKMKYDLYERVTHRDLRFFTNDKSGGINYRIFNDTDIIQSFFYVVLINIPMSVIMTITVGVFMLTINVSMSLFVFAVVAVMSAFTKFISKPVMNLTKEQRTNAQLANGTITEFVKIIRLIKGMGIGGVTANRVDEQLNSLKKSNIKVSVLNKWVAVAFSIINNVWALLVLWYGGYLVIDGKITLGLLMAFFMYANMLYPQINSIFNSVISFQQVKVSVQRYNEYYYIEKKIKALPQYAKIVDGNIRFENVSFSFIPGQQVLDRLNCEFNKNEITILKGANGSGKTTLCSLIKSFYHTYEGRILIDGKELSEFSEEELDKNIKYLPQDEFVFSGTIGQNLSVDDLSICSEQLRQVLDKVGLKEFIESLPNGFETQVGESGALLSGGQKQRIAFARLLLCKPKVVLLDEPTAFADEKAQRILLDCVKELKAYSTVIVVMHSSSSFEIADKLIDLAG